jgi:serine/threonine protein kinase/Flp pilus assembly protein TadD
MNERDIFMVALEREAPADRRTYVAEACQGDEGLRQGVEALLAAHERAGSFLASPAVGAPALVDGPPVREGPGTVIGPYKLLEQIGEGGFGVVYMAEQHQPVRRKVALKVVKPGMDTRQVVARFEVEQQALALMDHPNIAHVFDGGVTASGRPYFVMELVRGVPITVFCDQNQVPVRERLELFLSVCGAVQHAHQKGIIHRDLKPNNILVTLHDDKSVVKVIDFGIAKAIGQQLTDKTLFTNFAQMMGTPIYMSPEQAQMSGLDVDTRSDIYSLGVLLYELLTGMTPLDSERLRTAAFDEIRRIIREEDPVTPSARMTTLGQAGGKVSANRQSDPERLSKLFRSELDWIVMKALEKDRNRRYETASAFAADVERYLKDEQVQACPPSTAYRFKKFVRRNRGPVIASAAIVIALIAGIIGTTIGLIGQARQRAEAQQQEQEAKNQAAIAEAVSQFQRDMLRSTSPFQSGDKVTVLQVMTAALKELDAGKLKDKPLVEANVREIIGETLHELGRYSEAEPVLRKALELRRSALSAPHWGIAKSLQALAGTLQELGHLKESEFLMREALEMRRAVLPAEHSDIATSLARLGHLLVVEGKYTEAESLCREALDIDRQRLPAGHPDIVSSLRELGWLLQVEDKFAEAEPLCREALDIRRRNLPPAHPDISESLNVLAVVLARSGRLAEAEPLFREMLEIDRQSLPAGHPRIGQSVNNLATVLQEQGKLAEAEPLQREGLQMRRKSLPAGHAYIAQSLKNLAVLLQEQGKFAEAEPLAREALAIRRKALPAGHPDIAGSLQNLGSLLKDLGKFADGEAALLEAERILITAQGLPPATHDRCVEALVRFYSAWNKSEPGKGYDAKAEQWKAKLPTTRPPP